MYTPLDREMVLLQLCRLKFSQKETLWQTLFDWTLILFTKMTNSLFEPPFGGVRSNVCTSSIARWKASGRLPIRDNWTLRRYKQILVEVCVLHKGWVTLDANFRCWATLPTNPWWYQKTRVIILSCGIKISALCSFVSQNTHVSDRQTDGQTDGQNYDH